MSEFDLWLAKNADLRADIISFSKIPVLDVTKAIEMSEACGLMENEADAHLKALTAQAVIGAKSKYPDYTAKEREVLIRSDLASIQKFVFDLGVVGRTIRDRIYSQHRR